MEMLVAERVLARANCSAAFIAVLQVFDLWRKVTPLYVSSALFEIAHRMMHIPIEP